jgi:hypothetical protein
MLNRVDRFGVIVVRRDEQCETEVEEDSVDAPKVVEDERDVLPDLEFNG